MKDNFRWVPDRFKTEWIFVYNRKKVVVGDSVEAMRNLKWTDIVKWTVYEVVDLLINPKPNIRWFSKQLVLEWVDWEFNPKRFRKIEE